MHLLSKKQTVIYGLGYSLFSIYLVHYLITSILEQSVSDIVTAGVMCVGYAYMWNEYLTAFKRRMYDRSYAAAKSHFYSLLGSVLPDVGRMALEHQGQRVAVYRGTLLFSGDYFSLLVAGESDLSYNEATMTHTVATPNHSYYVNKRKLFVDKSFSVAVTRVVKDDTSSELLLSRDPEVVVSPRDARKALRETPADLQHASIEEMEELSRLLADAQQGIVS